MTQEQTTVSQIIRDYFELPGVDFLKKYPSVEKEAYWNGEDGEGLMQALNDYRLIPELKVMGINEWLDYQGIDRAYRKDMKPTYEKIKEDLQAQLDKDKETLK